MKKAISVVVLLVTLNVTQVFAHEGARIWVGNVGGTITTFRSDNDLEPTSYFHCRLFATELDEFFGIFTTEFPGYEVRQTGGDVFPGTTFGFNIAGPALYFDELSNSFVTTEGMFGPPQPGPVPQMAVSQGSNIRMTASGPVSGFNFFSFNSVGDHSHLAYTLLGDGATASDGPSGIYAVSFELTSNALSTSQTYYLLIGKDVAMSSALFDQAVAAARADLIGPGIAGDMNCDGLLDLSDVPEFVNAVLAGLDGGNNPGCCNLITADMNHDLRADGADVAVMVDSLI